VASLGIRGKRWAWRGLTYPGLLPQRRAWVSEARGPSRKTLRISPAGSDARKPAQLGEALRTRACCRNSVWGWRRLFEPFSLKRQFTLDQVPNGGGGQSYIASPEVQVKGLPALECRSFKYQNNGPLHFGRMFPGWNLRQRDCFSSRNDAHAGRDRLRVAFSCHVRPGFRAEC